MKSLNERRIKALEQVETRLAHWTDVRIQAALLGLKDAAAWAEQKRLQAATEKEVLKKRINYV